jgi:hypothetical protein
MLNWLGVKLMKAHKAHKAHKVQEESETVALLLEGLSRAAEENIHSLSNRNAALNAEHVLEVETTRLLTA